MRKIYSTLLLVMAMLCIGANNASAQDEVTFDKEALQYALDGINGSLTFANYDSSFDDDVLNYMLYYIINDGLNLYYDYHGNYYIVPNEEGTTILAPDDCSNLFYNLTDLTTITFDNFNTDNVTDMNQMFYGCENLQSITFGENFSTSSVTDMSCMFRGCNNLTSLDLSSFNTSNVKDMNCMFYECKNLQSITFGENFNTSSVTDMSEMFSGCNNLTMLDLSGFNTSNVTNMSLMFPDCSSLTTIIVDDDWSTANVTTSEGMFSGCTSLKGQNGTAYSAEHVDATYARVDGGEANPGYFRHKNASGTLTLYVEFRDPITDFSSPSSLSLDEISSYNIYFTYEVAGEPTKYYYPYIDGEDGIYRNVLSQPEGTVAFMDNGSTSSYLHSDLEGDYYFALGNVTYDPDDNYPASIPLTITYPAAYTVAVGIIGDGGILIDRSYDNIEYLPYYNFLFKVGENHKLFAMPGDYSHYVKWVDNKSDEEVTQGLGVDSRGCHYLEITGAQDGDAFSYMAYFDFNEIEKTVAQGKYGTIILPYAWDVPSGWTAYSCSGTEEKTDAENNTYTVVTLTEVDSPQANTPYIVKNNDGDENYKFDSDNWVDCATATVTEGLLIGVLAKDGATIPNDSYVLATNKTTHEQAFYKTDGSVTCPQYKCYLTLAAAPGEAKSMIGFSIDDETDGIDDLQFDNLQFTNGKYIENDRVVIVKNGKKFNVNGQEVK